MWFQNLCCGRSFVLLGTVQSSTNTLPIDNFDIKAGVQQACVFMPLFSYVFNAFTGSKKGALKVIRT